MVHTNPCLPLQRFAMGTVAHTAGCVVCCQWVLPPAERVEPPAQRAGMQARLSAAKLCVRSEEGLTNSIFISPQGGCNLWVRH